MSMIKEGAEVVEHRPLDGVGKGPSRMTALGAQNGTANSMATSRTTERGRSNCEKQEAPRRGIGRGEADGEHVFPSWTDLNILRRRRIAGVIGADISSQTSIMSVKRTKEDGDVVYDWVSYRPVPCSLQSSDGRRHHYRI